MSLSQKINLARVQLEKDKNVEQLLLSLKNIEEQFIKSENQHLIDKNQSINMINSLNEQINILVEKQKQDKQLLTNLMMILADLKGYKVENLEQLQTILFNEFKKKVRIL